MILKHFRSHRLLHTLATVLACAIIAFAQSEPDEKSTDTKAKGTITGRVVNESGQPLGNTEVGISSYGGGEGQVVTTDADGKFQATDLAPIAYLISVYAPSYVPRPRDPDVNPIGYYHIGDSVRLEMMKGGVITGSVTRPNGVPVVSITVNVYMIRDYKGQPPRYSRPTRSTGTDDRGIYRIYGLAPGTYVIAAGGGRVSGYGVNPFATDAPTFAPSSSRDTASEVPVNAGEEVSGIDIRYRDEPGHTVSGSVASANTTDQGFGITLTSVLGFEQTIDASQAPGKRGFMFSGVADGEYEMIAQTYSAAGWSLSESQRIKVKGADINGIELNVKPLASISGSVVLEASKVAECQGKRRPALGEIVIGAYHNEKNMVKDQPQFVWGLGGPMTPDPHGTFRLQNLAAGQYRFITRPLAKYWYLKSLAWPPSSKVAQSNQPLDAARNWTTVKMGDSLSGLTVTFAAGASSLQGRIESAAGKLPPRAFVYLAPAETEKREDILRYFVALAESDGSFVVTNVPPGRYWVLARAAAETDSNILSKLRLPDENELRARILHDGELAETAAQLKPCQNVTGFSLPLH
jgi:Carboxypeptidase regulatory-like domain